MKKVLAAAVTIAAIVPLIELTTSWGSTSYRYLFPKAPNGTFSLCNAPSCSSAFEAFEDYLGANVGKIVQLDITFKIDSYFGYSHICNELIDTPVEGETDGMSILANLEVVPGGAFGEEARCMPATWIEIERNALRLAYVGGAPPTYIYSAHGRFYVTARRNIYELTSELPG